MRAVSQWPTAIGHRFADGAAASLILVASVILSLVWIVGDSVPRFRASPVSSPLQHTVLDGYGKPAVTSIQADLPVEIGVAIRPVVAGTVTGLRFYKIAGDLGPHVGSLWSRKGELLGEAAFAQESASGWQEATFAKPVNVEADQLLIASYFAPVGGQIVSDPSPLAGSVPMMSPSTLFRIPALAKADRPSSVYHLGESGFPATGSGETPFWVDIVFVPAPAAT